ncbi:MAG: contractile injection system tape measure protein [Prolixibacteraceae bacterium]
MRTLPHKISKQQWKVFAETADQAFALRQQLNERWQETLLPVFDKVFTEFASGDDVILIPKIEIILKVAYGKEIWENIAQELYHQLSNSLRNEDQTNKGTSDNVTEKVSIPADQYRLEVLLHYLHNGDLPRQSGFQTEVVSTLLIATIQEHWQKLAEYILFNQVSQPFLFRLIQLLSFGEVIQLTEDVTGHLSLAAKKELNLMLFALLNSDEYYFDPHTSLMLAAAFLHAGISNSIRRNIPNWEEAASRLLTADKLNEVRKFLVLIPGNLLFFSTSTSDDKETDAKVETQKEAGQISKLRIFGTDFNAKFEESEGQDTSLPGKMNSSDPSEIFYGNRSASGGELSHSDSLLSQAKESRYSVQNAGLLLLHPFLVRLFVYCGILPENEKIISVWNLSKAAALLHFLATGRDEVFEFELGFIKVLLGLNPDQPLAVSKGLLSKSQKEEVDSLLNSVIEHWASLKSTSKEGLRSSFIQRNGLLLPNEDGWKIHLESAAYDVLLKTIPWSYSIIKLPWMNKPIYT